MTAARHVSPNQLRMFIPAGELADPSKYEHYDVKYNSIGEDYEDIKARKVEESKRGRGWNIGGDILSLRESIQSEGIKQPVGVYVAPPASTPDATRKPMLGNGHHRVFTANDLDPKTEVPVRWQE